MKRFVEGVDRGQSTLFLFLIYRDEVGTRTLYCSTDNERNPAHLVCDRYGDDRAAGLRRCI